MLRVAWKMLRGDRAKYTGLLLGIAFTSFLVTFSGSFLCGFITRGFALIAENGTTDVWVMDPTVFSDVKTTNIPGSMLNRVRGIDGVRSAMPLALGTAEVRFPNGRFQAFQVIGVDDATLIGAPNSNGGRSPDVLHAPAAVIADAGGTSGKLQTPSQAADRWPADGPHLDAPTRRLTAGDELLVNDRRVMVAGLSNALPRYPPEPLLFTTFSNAARILPPERWRLTFILVRAEPGVSPRQLAARIAKQTGLRARVTADFKADTVSWLLTNSEDVGDVGTMLALAVVAGFGVTGVMLYMFTAENLRQYAVLKALGATARLLVTMVFVQAGACALLGTGIGLGLCAIVGEVAATEAEYPFRMLWFTPVLGTTMVLLVSAVAAGLSLRPVLTLQPGVVFAGR